MPKIARRRKNDTRSRLARRASGPLHQLERVRVLRKLTKSELGRRVGRSHTLIRLLERGHVPTVDLMNRIAAELDVNATWLTNGALAIVERQGVLVAL